jgi:hypothetical protein
VVHDAASLEVGEAALERRMKRCSLFVGQLVRVDDLQRDFRAFRRSALIGLSPYAIQPAGRAAGSTLPSNGARQVEAIRYDRRTLGRARGHAAFL